MLNNQMKYFTKQLYINRFVQDKLVVQKGLIQKFSNEKKRIETRYIYEKGIARAKYPLASAKKGSHPRP